MGIVPPAGYADQSAGPALFAARPDQRQDSLPHSLRQRRPRLDDGGELGVRKSNIRHTERHARIGRLMQAVSLTGVITIYATASRTA